MKNLKMYTAQTPDREYELTITLFEVTTKDGLVTWYDVHYTDESPTSFFSYDNSFLTLSEAEFYFDRKAEEYDKRIAFIKERLYK